MNVRRLAATFVSLSLLESASARADQAAEASGAGAGITIARRGTLPSRQGPAQNFTGSVRVDPMFEAVAPSRLGGASVTFEPGARTAWHVHPLGQILIVTAGVGRVQGWRGPLQEIRPGDVVRIPPGQKHWHGASPDASMSHVALVEHLDGKTTDWLEQVSEAEYRAPVAGSSASK